MIRSLIIDDEPACIHHLSALIEEKVGDRVHLMGHCSSAEEGLQAIDRYRPDLVFLDIELGNNTTGFDVLKALRDFHPHIIFTTAFEKYAIQAFRVSAVDYLLKPLDGDELVAAVRKYEERTPGIRTNEKLELLLSNLYHTNKRICVPVVNGIVILNVSDIIYCEADSNYTTIFLNDQQKITVAKTLKEFDEMLNGFNFFRIHQSLLVNLSYIRTYNKGKGGSVVLKGGQELEVSTRRKEDFLKRLDLS